MGTWAQASETEQIDMQPGDSVTPTGGVFKGQRFLVMELHPAKQFGEPPEARIRPYPARQGGPSPMWVPIDELEAFFSLRLCPVCGDSGHRRCDQSPELPAVGWRVETIARIKAFNSDDDIMNGERGTVVKADAVGRVVVVEFDCGPIVQWGGYELGQFFYEVEVL